VSVVAPRDTFNGVGVGRKTGSEAGEAIRRGHFRSGGLVATCCGFYIRTFTRMVAIADRSPARYIFELKWRKCRAARLFNAGKCGVPIKPTGWRFLP
jgi:hypothetical protein